MATVFSGIVSASMRLLAVSKSAQLWDVTVPEVQPSVWEPLAPPVDHPLPKYVRIAYAAAVPDRLDIFITVDEIAYTQVWNKSGWHGWKRVVEGDLMRTWWS